MRSIFGLHTLVLDRRLVQLGGFLGHALIVAPLDLVIGSLCSLARNIGFLQLGLYLVQFGAARRRLEFAVLGLGGSKAALRSRNFLLRWPRLDTGQVFLCCLQISLRSIDLGLAAAFMELLQVGLGAVDIQLGTADGTLQVGGIQRDEKIAGSHCLPLTYCYLAHGPLNLQHDLALADQFDRAGRSQRVDDRSGRSDFDQAADVGIYGDGCRRAGLAGLNYGRCRFLHRDGTGLGHQQAHVGAAQNGKNKKK